MRPIVSVCAYSLLVLQASCSSSGDPAPTIDARWELVRLRGKAVIKGYSPLVAEFQPDGQVQWYGGINSFLGRYRCSGNSISIDLLQVTLVGGAGELEKQEAVFDEVMKQASTFLFEGNARLIFRNADGKVVAVFRKVFP